MKDPGVIDKEANYRMWYECYDVAGWPTTDDTSFCYAESRDGVHWTKPELGLFEFQGSKKNNILFRQIGDGAGRSRVHGSGLFIDPTAPPEARYKVVSQGIWAGQTPPHRISGMYSPDGIHWTRYPKTICDMFADSQYSGFWDARIGKYVIYGRFGSGIGRAESRDFAQFPLLQPVLQTDFNDPANSNLYNSYVVKYANAANVYLTFPSLYQRTPDTLDIRLATSRDGVKWTYPDQSTAYIPLGPPGSWESSSSYMGEGVIQAGDETWVYYSGSPLLHNKTELEDLVKCKQPRAMSRLVIRRDRFVSIDAEEKLGWFVTPPLQFRGNTLRLNVAVRSGGQVRVALLDEKGKPLPGRGLQDCEPITGDELDAVVHWKNGTDVGSRADRPTRMRFALHNASLFGFQFVTAEPSGLPEAGTFRLWQLPPQTDRNVMMSYVAQSPSGKLVVIDGGWTEDAPYLHKFLRNLGGHVDTWFITHQHDDHLGAVTPILGKLDGLKVDRIVASLLSDDWIKQHEPDQLAAVQAFNAAVATAGKSITAAKPGDELKIDGLRVEVLAVSDASQKDPGNFINNQCMVLRLSTPGTSVLFLADLGVQGGQRLLAGKLGGERLQSEYVQMAHHGQRGVARNVYEAIHARSALWPAPEWLYETPRPELKTVHRTGEVRQWMKDLGVDRYYVMKDGLIELQLPMLRSDDSGH
jgi:L-ascorbate metabolism protein UlaG (beta-lactamase superfamily)